MIIAVTGHRPDKLGGYGSVTPEVEWVARHIKHTLKGLNTKLLLTGMALGTDQIAALMAWHNGIPFAACVPFVGQEATWSEPAQGKYRELLEMAQRVIYTDQYASKSTKSEVYKLLQWRNEWMVDRADLVIAVWDGSSGGTANCVKYAQLMGKPIYRIDPARRVVSQA